MERHAYCAGANDTKGWSLFSRGVLERQLKAWGLSRSPRAETKQGFSPDIELSKTTGIGFGGHARNQRTNPKAARWFANDFVFEEKRGRQRSLSIGGEYDGDPVGIGQWGGRNEGFGRMD